MTRSPLKSYLHVVVVVFLLSPSLLPADGPATMVRDIKTEEPFETFPYPGARELVVLGDYVYFATADGSHGEELWRWSSFTGAEMVADICPGACPSYPYELTIFEDRLFFTAGGEAGRELWQSDGTSSGTRMVLDIEEGGGSSYPFFLTPFDGRLYFSAGKSLDEDRELWASDGTASGTARVADIVPGPVGSNPVALVELAGELYFTADDGSVGRELWRSDGTAAGTERVLDLCPGVADCHWDEQWFFFGRRTLNPVGGNLLMHGVTHGSGEDLALLEVADTTVSFLPVEQSTVFGGFGRLDDLSFFPGCVSVGDCEPWRSDGTVAGTFLLADIAPGTPGSSPEFLGAAGGWMYFMATPEGGGNELWKSDGTEASTEFVSLINPSPGGIEDDVFYPGIALGDRLVFKASDGVSGTEPWITDGTGQGTFRLRDIYPGSSPSVVDWLAPMKMAALDGEVLFFALDPESGFALWRTEGTEAGTVLAVDLDRQPSSLPWVLTHGRVLWAGGFQEELYFGADDGTTGVELWASDGTEAGTRLVADLEPGVSTTGLPDSSTPQQFATSAERLFVGAYRGTWGTDGTAAGTERLAGEYGGTPIAVRSFVKNLALPEAFFVADSSELLVSDGTAAGTTSLGSGGRVEAAGNVVFYTRDGDELRLVEEDGLTTHHVRTFPDDYIEMLGVVAGRLLFAVDDGMAGRELWVSDGTTAGTELVADINPGPDGSDPRLQWTDRPAINSRGLFFTAEDGTSGREPWVSDGTALGTRRVADLWPGSVGSAPSEIVTVGERVFFMANDGQVGRELWTALGEEAPRLVRDISPGFKSAIPLRTLDSQMIAVGDRVFFGATDGEQGVELWASDGTAAGTFMLQDIHPGPGSSSPENFVLAGDCLYFSATDGVHGFEPWVLPLRPAASAAEVGCTPARVGVKSPAGR